MKLERKHIIGIVIAVAILVLGLVVWFLAGGSDEDYYEGETVPIETGEDIFDDEQEDSTSESEADESNDSESDTSESDNGKSNTEKSNGAENTADGKDADEKDKTESSDDTSDTKDEEEGGNADLDEGWSPFY